YEQYISKLFQQLGLEAGIPFGDSELNERIKQAVNDIRLVGMEIYRVHTGETQKERQLQCVGEPMAQEYFSNRIMNNYMLWNTMDAYAWHLSYEMAAIQQWHYTNLDTDLQTDCLIFTHELFGTVLGAIFVENHLHGDAVNHTKTMLTHLKSSAYEQIEKTKWMDYDTKKKLERR
ncbi:hypothetical protein X801_07818, partial [Opisthorchis viverrini]